MRVLLILIIIGCNTAKKTDHRMNYEYPHEEVVNIKTYLWIQDSIAKKHGWARPYYDSVNKMIVFPY